MCLSANKLSSDEKNTHYKAFKTKKKKLLSNANWWKRNWKCKIHWKFLVRINYWRWITISVSVKRDCGLRTADCRPGVKCRLCVKCSWCRLQTESKTQAVVKCRPSINCSRGLVERFNKGKKNPPQKIHVIEHYLLTWRHLLHKSIPFFSGMSSTTQKHNRNLEPFLNLTLQL